MKISGTSIGHPSHLFFRLQTLILMIGVNAFAYFLPIFKVCHRLSLVTSAPFLYLCKFIGNFANGPLLFSLQSYASQHHSLSKTKLTARSASFLMGGRDSG